MPVGILGPGGVQRIDILSVRASLCEAGVAVPASIDSHGHQNRERSALYVRVIRRRGVKEDAERSLLREPCGHRDEASGCLGDEIGVPREVGEGSSSCQHSPVDRTTWDGCKSMQFKRELRWRMNHGCMGGQAALEAALMGRPFARAPGGGEQFRSNSVAKPTATFSCTGQHRAGAAERWWLLWPEEVPHSVARQPCSL